MLLNLRCLTWPARDERALKLALTLNYQTLTLKPHAGRQNYPWSKVQLLCDGSARESAI